MSTSDNQIFSSITRKIHARQEKLQKYQKMLFQNNQNNQIDTRIPSILLCETSLYNQFDSKRNLPELSKSISSQTSLMRNSELKQRSDLAKFKIEEEINQTKKNFRTLNDVSFLQKIPNRKNPEEDILNKPSIIKEGLENKSLSTFYAKMYNFDHGHNFETNITAIKEKSTLSKKIPAKLLDLSSLGFSRSGELNKTQITPIQFHTSQNKLLKNPNARKDIEELNSWLTFMIQKESQKENSGNISLESAQMLYNASLTEIIRQISIDCSERGQFLQKIWDSYIGILESALLESRKELEKIDQNNTKEIARIHQMYNLEFENLQKTIKSLQKDKSELNISFENLKSDYRLMKIKLKKNLNESAIYYKELLGLRKENEILLNKNLDLNIRLDDYESGNPLERKLSSPSRKKTDYSKKEYSSLSKNKKKYQIVPGGSVVSHLIYLKDGESSISQFPEPKKSIFETKSTINEEEISKLENVFEEIEKDESLKESQIMRKMGSTMENKKTSLSYNRNKKQSNTMIGLTRKDENVVFEESVEKEAELRSSNSSSIEEIEKNEMCTDTFDLIEKEDKNFGTEEEEFLLKTPRKEFDSDLKEIENLKTEDLLIKLKEIIENINLNIPEKELIQEELKIIEIKVEKSHSIKKKMSFYEQQNQHLKLKTRKLLIEINEKSNEITDLTTQIKTSEKKMESFFESIDESEIRKDKKYQSIFEKFTENILSKIDFDVEKSDSPKNENPLQIQRPDRSKFKSKILNTILLKNPNSKIQKTINQRMFSVYSEEANNIISECKKENLKVVRPTTQFVLLKFISAVLQERKKPGKNTTAVPLHIICYEFLVSKYGLKKIADMKFKQIFATIFIYEQESYKISIFSKLLINSDSSDFSFYFNSLMFMEENGKENIAGNTNLIVKINYENALSLIEKQHLSKEFNSIVIQLEEKRVFDTKTGAYLIDFDFLMLKLLETYWSQKEKMKQHLQHIFYSADLDQDEYIEFYEFLTLYRYIEKEKFEFEKVQILFMENCDFLVPSNGERALSFSKFIDISFQNDLFGEEKTKKFTENIDPIEKIKNFDDFFNNYEESLSTIKIRLIESKSFNSYYNKILDNLEKTLTKNEIDKYKIWISYRLIDEESKRILIDFYMISLIPNELKTIGDLWFEINQYDL